MRQLTQMALALVALSIVVLLTSCAPVRHTPFGEQTETSISNFIEINKGLLPAINFGENRQLSFSIISDSHANYEDLEAVIPRLNNSSSDFVVNLGDMTDLGLAVEYDAFMYFMKELRKPWFTVIGNHDAVGNGKNIFRRLFGDYNHIIDFGGVRFVLFNNNALDFYREGIDLDWLESAVNSSSDPVIIFQHVNPFNSEYFSSEQQSQIQRILDTGKVAALFHGHLHTFVTSKYKNVLIQQIGRVEREQYAHVDIKGNTLTVNNCRGGSCEKVIHSIDLNLE